MSNPRALALEKLLLGPDALEYAKVICQQSACVQGGERVLRALLFIHESKNNLLHLLIQLFQHQIDTVSGDELFQLSNPSSTCMRGLSVYCIRHLKEYMKHIVDSCIAATVSSAPSSTPASLASSCSSASLVSDFGSSPLPSDSSASPASASSFSRISDPSPSLSQQSQLECHMLRTIGIILMSIERLPPAFRLLCSSLASMVERKFPGRSSRLIGDFFILRTVAPALVTLDLASNSNNNGSNPPKPIDPSVRKNLLLVAKTLHKLHVGERKGVQHSNSTTPTKDQKEGSISVGSNAGLSLDMMVQLSTQISLFMQALTTAPSQGVSWIEPQPKRDEIEELRPLYLDLLVQFLRSRYICNPSTDNLPPDHYMHVIRSENMRRELSVDGIEYPEWMRVIERYGTIRVPIEWVGRSKYFCSAGSNSLPSSPPTFSSLSAPAAPSLNVSKRHMRTPSGYSPSMFSSTFSSSEVAPLSPFTASLNAVGDHHYSHHRVASSAELALSRTGISPPSSSVLSPTPVPAPSEDEQQQQQVPTGIRGFFRRIRLSSASNTPSAPPPTPSNAAASEENNNSVPAVVVVSTPLPQIDSAKPSSSDAIDSASPISLSPISSTPDESPTIPLTVIPSSSAIPLPQLEENNPSIVAAAAAAEIDTVTTLRRVLTSALSFSFNGVSFVLDEVQLQKDSLRDEVELNGRLYQNVEFDVLKSALTAAIEADCPEEVAKGRTSELTLAALLFSNRTSSGGDAYDACLSVFGSSSSAQNSKKLSIFSDSVEKLSPIRISTANGHLLLSSSTFYRVIELDENEDVINVWARVSATTERELIHGHCATVLLEPHCEASILTREQLTKLRQVVSL